jgi:ABC-2 type transport system permease protein
MYPETGFAVGSNQKAYPLGVVVEGNFESYFKGKPSPFETTTTGETQTDPNALPTLTPTTGLIESSPNTARLIVIGSGEFLNDTVFQITSNLSQDSYLNNLQFVQNTVDWATEDTDLLSIRSRGTTARTLDPLTDKEETQWEVLNYVVALISLLVLGAVWQWRKRAERPMALVLAESESGANG